MTEDQAHRVMITAHTKGSCVVARVNGGYRNGGVTIRIRSGEEKHLNGKQALADAAHEAGVVLDTSDYRTLINPTGVFVVGGP